MKIQCTRVIKMRKNRKFEKYEVKEIERHWAKAQKRKMKDGNALRRLQILYLRVKGKTNAEISEIVGFSEQYIIKIVAKYRNKGMEAILEDKRTGNNRKLRFEEEADFWNSSMIWQKPGNWLLSVQ